jgi:AcrR family transcriptional regulator
MSKIAERTGRTSARERLLAAAGALFYEEGFNNVGIERVIERAGVAKASLYDCFGSKEALIRAYLQSRLEARQVRLREGLAKYTTPRERLLGVFDILGHIIADPSYRGCAFVKANAEALAGGSIRAVCEDSRGWLRDLLIELSKDAGATDPDGLAQQLLMLYDGASISAQMDRNPDAARAARAAAAALLDVRIEAGPKEN